MELQCKIEKELFKLLVQGKEVSFPMKLGEEIILVKVKLGEISVKEMLNNVLAAHGLGEEDPDAVQK